MLDAGLLAGCPRAGRALKVSTLLVAKARAGECGASGDGPLHADACVFYSDAVVSCFGRAARALKRRLAAAAAMVATGLRALDCPNSASQTEVPASDIGARDAVQAALQDSELAAYSAKATENLGVDFRLDGRGLR